jgi:hypothetical protein
MAGRMMKSVDTNQDGKITQDELTEAVHDSGNKQGLSAQELLQQLDQAGKGYITRQDIETGLQRAQSTSFSASQPPPGRGGPPPTGDPMNTSNTYTFDPEDLNQDGTVTNQEEIQYLLTQYTAQTAPAPNLQSFQLEG